MNKKTGFAFPEYVSTEKIRRRSGGGGSENNTRENFLIVAVALVFIIVFAKVFYLQIIKGPYYRYLAESNRIKSVPIHAPRGVIFDRNGQSLVFNIPGFRRVNKGKTDLLSKDDALSLIAKGAKDLEVDSLRSYPHSDSVSHLLGYVGQVSEDDLKSEIFSSYNSGDLVGKTGIERQYEGLLRGVDGSELVEVDAKGNAVRKLGQTDPLAGRDIKLNLDIKIQEAVHLAMENVKKGAVIVSTPKGEILALYSKPTFDPNLFTMGKGYKVSSPSSYEKVEDILTDSQGQPLLNRAISGIYPPGSTYKLVVAATGLETGEITDSFYVEDTGVLRVGAFSFANWYFTNYGRTDGSVNVVKGIKRSNDIFFYKLAEEIGITKLNLFAEKFRLGRPLGIDLDGEEEGVMPNPKWKEENINEPWYLGDTYNYGIGQGYILTTPLHVNAWTQAIANEGVLYAPKIIKSGNPRKLTDDFLGRETISLIRQGMIESCEEGGVAWPFFGFKVKNKDLKIDGKNYLEAPQATTSSDFKDYRRVVVACKTGTAEQGGEDALPHAWITLYAPSYKPEIVVTVLAEESGEGSNIAGPIAKKIVEAYFTK